MPRSGSALSSRRRRARWRGATRPAPVVTRCRSCSPPTPAAARAQPSSRDARRSPGATSLPRSICWDAPEPRAQPRGGPSPSSPPAAPERRRPRSPRRCLGGAGPRERWGRLGGPSAFAAGGLRRLMPGTAARGEWAADRFGAAELARASLGAPRLAARLYLDFARLHPTSLFAPKAMIAALPLSPAAADSLLAVLDSGYATSPYTQALHGAASPAFAAAEDSPPPALGVRHPQSRGLGSPLA